MNQPLDALIVLGAGIAESRRRARYAAEIAPEKIPIVVCGGRIKFLVHGTEAGHMRNQLVELGINSERIMTETQSYSTLTNLEYAKDLLDNLNVKRVGIVSGKAHMARIRRLSKRILNNYETEFYPVKIRNFKELLIEGISLYWEILSSFNSHGLSYYLKPR